MTKISYIPASWGHWLPVMKLTNFSVMQVNNKWHVMPDWNNPNIAMVPWVFNPLYNTSLIRKYNV